MLRFSAFSATPGTKACSPSGSRLRKRLRPQIEQVGAEVPADVAAEFYTSAALGLLVWWIDKDFCGDHVWMTGLYRKLAVREPHSTA